MSHLARFLLKLKNSIAKTYKLLKILNIMHFLKKIKEILFNPEKFFLNLSKEKGVQDSLLFYVILLAFSVLMGYLFKIILGETYTRLFYSIFNLNMPLPEYNALSLISTTI